MIDAKMSITDLVEKTPFLGSDLWAFARFWFACRAQIHGIYALKHSFGHCGSGRGELFGSVSAFAARHFVLHLPINGISH